MPVQIQQLKQWINTLEPNVPFPYPLKTLENLRGYRNGTLGLNGFMFEGNKKYVVVIWRHSIVFIVSFEHIQYALQKNRKIFITDVW